jgi:catechol 2,3-dioxygenase-like lactoylglutathione lyase family enzyme
MPWEIAIPVLPSLEMSRTIAFYEKKLGFQVVSQYGDSYAILRKEHIFLHFWLCDLPIVVENSSCYVRVSRIEELYETYRSQNIVHPNGHLETKPWGMKQFSILDEDGNLITFGEPAAYQPASVFDPTTD